MIYQTPYSFSIADIKIHSDLRLRIGLFSCPISSSIRLFILCRAIFKSFCWLYLSTKSFFVLLSYIVPSCWSIWIFFAIIDLALPSLGPGSINASAGEVPNILLRINFFSLVKFPFYPSISDSKKMNLPFRLP